MFVRLVKLRTTVDIYCIKQQLLLGHPLPNALTADDQQDITDLIALLRPLKSITETLEGNATNGSHGALQEWLPAVDFLLHYLEIKKKEQEFKEDTYFKAYVELGQAKLDKYYNLSNDTLAYRVAIALHPIKKLKWFQKHWSNKQSWITAVEMQLRKLFEEERTRQQLSLPVSATSATATTTSSHKQSLFDLYNDVDDSTTASLKDELSIFLAKPLVSLLKDQHSKQLLFNPIYWWRDDESRFPILA